MKRGWDGDVYAALRDCLTALSYDPGHIKAHLRLARCLTDLEWLVEAAECLELFKVKHPEHRKSGACSQLEKDLAAAQEKASNSKEPQVRVLASGSRNPASLGRYTAASFLRSEPNQATETVPSELETMDLDSDDDSDNAIDEAVQSAETSSSAPSVPPPPGQEPNFEEMEWRRKARDFSYRFLGACNTTTDIKEANFLGRNGQFIMAGSDDGKFFIWDRVTSNIVKVLVGDESIVNCLQTHPWSPILATSGIEPVVRIWQPRPEETEEKDSREIEDLAGAAVSNQRRMNADPFETILLNMGYRMNVDEDTGEPSNEGAVQCRPS
jgi:WD and tetratricopeptide repeat-containing protein 1